jgi:hypothetical protein
MENQPQRPAHSLFFALGMLPCSRPPGGPVPGTRHPSLGPVCRSNKSQPSIMIQQPPGFCTRTKPRRVNSSAHNSSVGSFSLSLSLSLTHSLLRRSEWANVPNSGKWVKKTLAQPLALSPVRAHRWVDTPPLRGLTTVSFITRIPAMVSSSV